MGGARTQRVPGFGLGARSAQRRHAAAVLAVGCWLLAVGCWLLAVGCFGGAAGKGGVPGACTGGQGRQALTLCPSCGGAPLEQGGVPPAPRALLSRGVPPPDPQGLRPLRAQRAGPCYLLSKGEGGRLKRAADTNRFTKDNTMRCYSCVICYNNVIVTDNVI
jgi:hypothetical protein